MNKRIARKIYQRTIFKASMLWGPRLTDREREAHRIWWRKSKAFRASVNGYTRFVGIDEDTVDGYLKEVNKIINQVSFKNEVFKAVSDRLLFGNSYIEVDDQEVK